MRFGIYVPNFGEVFGDPAVLCSLAVAAESAGWDGFFLWDHVVVPGEPVVVGPVEPVVADVWVALGAIAASTSSVTIGPLVTGVPRRRPWKLALEAATLQRLSRGRAVVGVSVGTPPDYSPFGESLSGRVARTREGVELMKALWSGKPVEYSGEVYRASGVQYAPVDVPLWVGGAWPRSVPFVAAEHAAGVVPALFGPSGLRVPSVREIADARAEFVASGGPADGDVVMWAGAGELDVAAYEEVGVTWMLTDGGGGSPAELRSFVEAGPPG